MLAVQELYHFRHTTSPFCSGYFGNRISLFAWDGQDHNLNIFKLPTISGMMGMHHYDQFVFPLGWGSHKLFCPGWPGTMILSISAFQISRITGVNHWHSIWKYISCIWSSKECRGSNTYSWQIRQQLQNSKDLHAHAHIEKEI
jgi:hypothetical protein